MLKNGEAIVPLPPSFATYDAYKHDIGIGKLAMSTYPFFYKCRGE